MLMVVVEPAHPSLRSVRNLSSCPDRRPALTVARQRLNSARPVKQRRALLESNPPRDSWIDRRRNEVVSTFGEAKTSPKARRETFISEPEHAFQNSSKPVSKSSNCFRHSNEKTLEKTTLTGTRFFEASPYSLRAPCSALSPDNPKTQSQRNFP